jgi:acetyltransferase-like isoleucine patch superfamily enzyme
MNTKFNGNNIFVGENVDFGMDVSVWDLAYISSDVSIGDMSIIGRNVYIGRGVKIGKRVKIQNNVLLYEGAIIEDDVFLGPNVVITNDLYPRATIDGRLKMKRDWTLLSTHVHNNASLAANVVVVCGNEIGEYSLIGAASVVTKNVPAYALMVGNPAKRIGDVDKNGVPIIR